MKLIIDIPNEVYETRNFVDYFGAWSTKLLETIDTGIPYEEQPQGEWQNPYLSLCGEFSAKCNTCGEDIIVSSSHRNFCPNCGADMRGDT